MHHSLSHKLSLFLHKLKWRVLPLIKTYLEIKTPPHRLKLNAKLGIVQM